MTDAFRSRDSQKSFAKMPANQENLNHLLNFTLPPRNTNTPQSIPRRSRKTGTQHGVWNKEKFVNAQYRFVMNPTGDYTVHFADPDIYFQWQDILQIIVPRSSAFASMTASTSSTDPNEGQTSCPICLSTPIAPRMTKCGHVYCFPCILHYLTTSENKWARCPICFDSVNEKQLKSVKWFDGPSFPEDDPDERIGGSSSSSTIDSGIGSTPREGSLMRLRLIQRPRITTLSLPRSGTWPSDLIPPHQAPFHFLPDVYDYAKFMLATPAYLVEDLTRDVDQLVVERRQLTAAGDEVGLVFVDAAEERLRRQIQKALSLDTPPMRESIERAQRGQHEVEERSLRQKKRLADAPMTLSDLTSGVPMEYLSIKDNGSVTLPLRGGGIGTPGRNNPRQRRNINPPPPSTATYYFYQAASGLPIFLHPLDIRILHSHFNGYETLPDTITIRIESLSEGSVNDDLRKRCKYLSHIPESADVVFVEADLHGVVGADGLKSFEGPLKMRKQKRRDKVRKDDRAKARAEEREREKESSVIPWASSIPSTPFTPSEDEIVPHERAASGPTQDTAGAWGSRSFASALNNPSLATPTRLATRPIESNDDFDLDIAWHELEQRSGGGRRKRANKLLVLGGIGGGGRRR